MTDAIEDTVARLSAEGFSLAQQGRAVQGSQFAYLETGREPGGMVELIERSPLTVEIFHRIHDAARNWDGRTPSAGLPEAAAAARRSLTPSPILQGTGSFHA